METSQKPCPSCGHCPTCGHTPTQMRPAWPYYNPWYFQPLPYVQPQWIPNGPIWQVFPNNIQCESQYFGTTTNTLAVT